MSGVSGEKPTVDLKMVVSGEEGGAAAMMTITLDPVARPMAVPELCPRCFVPMFEVTYYWARPTGVVPVATHVLCPECQKGHLCG